jgi:hypothetical protein
MAANSKREQILERIRTIAASLDSIATVRRIPYNEDNYLDAATSELPVVVVMGKLPETDPKFSDRSRRLDVAVSTLAVQLTVFAEDNETPDTTISSLVDDLWRAFYADITLGFDWVRQLVIEPDLDTLVAAPYIIFRLTIKVIYQHDAKGI